MANTNPSPDFHNQRNNFVQHTLYEVIRDDPATRNYLQSPTTEQIRTFIGDYKYIFLDEAQRIPGIGLTLKIITDQFKQVQSYNFV